MQPCPADVNEAMATVQLSVLAVPLSFPRPTLMNSLSSRGHAVPSSAMLCQSDQTVSNQEAVVKALKGDEEGKCEQTCTFCTDFVQLDPFPQLVSTGGRRRGD